MSAFSHSYRYQIEQNIRNLYRRRAAIARLTLTHDEYVDTFVPTEARKLFWDIAPYNGTGNWASGRLALRQFDHIGEAYLYIRGDQKPAPPLVKGLEVQPDAPTEVVDRIKSWLENGGDVSGDFGRVLATFNYLCANYGRAAMRHYWPTIMALCDGNEVTKPLIQEFQAMRPPASLKPLPPGLAAACRKTASTVSTAQLIPDDIKISFGKDWGEVSIESIHGAAYKEEGIGAFYGLS